VVLVHGAPQTGYCWRRVIPLLSGRFRVVVPDLRGYGRSDLAASGRYDLETLTDDLGRVLDHASKEPVVLVTHDWGAPPGYRLLERTPGRVRHLVGVNAPHHGAFARELLDPRQTVRSWYIGLFQLPFAERLAAWREAQFLLDLMRWSSPESAISHDDLEVYRGSLARPGRAEAVLAYYRQAFERPIRAALESGRRLPCRTRPRHAALGRARPLPRSQSPAGRNALSAPGPRGAHRREPLGPRGAARGGGASDWGHPPSR
jgi:pimeloyl-ACP methyl ester carboxylesterase